MRIEKADLIGLLLGAFFLGGIVALSAIALMTMP
jgi:hypothetical protein